MTTHQQIITALPIGKRNAKKVANMQLLEVGKKGNNQKTLQPLGLNKSIICKKIIDTTLL